MLNNNPPLSAAVDASKLTPEQRAMLNARFSKANRETGRVIDCAWVANQRTSRQGELPLSFAQQRLWFLDQLEPGSSLYNLSDAVHMNGALDIPALESAINEVVRRHESLRTVFPSVDGRPTQLITPELRLQLTLVDLTGHAVEERVAVWRCLAQDEADQPFDLARGPLLRVKLLRLDEREHVLLVTEHHIISDAWSTAIFFRELMAIYAAFREGRPCPLGGLPFQYADYAAWQREALAGEALEAQLGYWKSTLAGKLPMLDLPFARRYSSTASYSGATYAFECPKESLAALRVLCQREGVTLFMALFAVFSTLLCRYSKQDDIIIGTPLAGRNSSGTDKLIGLFVNTVVLRADLSGNPQFRELLLRLRQTALGAYAHQDTPFEKLVEDLQPERRLGRTPLFQVMLAFQNVPQEDWSIPGLTVTVHGIEPRGSKFDLTLSLSQSSQTLQGVFTYNTDLLDEAAVCHMGTHFMTLLRSAVGEPSMRILGLPMLSAAERQEITSAWNATRQSYPEERCLHDVITIQAERTPQGLAVVDDKVGLTYRELNQKANQLAHYLRRLGVRPDARVGLCLGRSVDMVVAILGVLKAGGAYVPIDPAFPTARISYMLADSQAQVLITEAACGSRACDDGVRRIWFPDDWRGIVKEPRKEPERTAGPSNLAYVIYTSGSTGKPKGVAIEHRQIVNYVLGVGATLQLFGNLTYAFVSTIAADLGNTVLFHALATGGILHVIPGETIMDAVGLGEYFQTHEIDCLKIVPSHLAALRSVMPKRVLVIGGETSSWEWIENWHTLEPGCAILNHYGPTEATVGVLTHRISLTDKWSAAVLGRPLPNARVYVLNSEMEPVPVGISGELYIGGRGVARGYVNRPALTADRFIPDVFSEVEGDRLYRTGDRVRYREDATVEFLGRVDSQVKLRGYRIELGEIEAILRDHPGVEYALAIVHEHDRSERRLIAYVVSRPHTERLDDGELRAYLKQRLPDHMIPAAFVKVKEMPRTLNGKIDRTALPIPSVAKRQESVVPPRNEVERVLCEIWKELLNHSNVGIEDNFFELGGDSILSIQVLARAMRQGIRVTAKQMFEHQTIAALAKVACLPNNGQADQDRTTGTVALTPIQQWFFERNLVELHHYNQSMLLEPRERLDRETLQQALRHVVAHHDALQFRFAQLPTGWQQRAGSDGEAPFENVDLSAYSRDEQDRRLLAIATAQQARLDVSNGPLFRVVLFDRGQLRPQRLLIVIHHLVVDGVSWRIIIEDLEMVYRQLRSAASMQLPPKTMSFQQWGKRLREYAQGREQRSELPAWVTETAREEARLPSDGPGGPNTVSSAREVNVSLSQEETAALLQDVSSAYNTHIDDALLTSLIQAVRQWTGQSSLWITLEGHGREPIFDDIDLSRTVGWFTSLHPVRLDVQDTADIGLALIRVKEHLRRVRHRGLGWGLWRYISREQQVMQRLKAEPQPELSFNYLGQFDQTFGSAGLFSDSAEPHGGCRSPNGERAHRIEVCGAIRNGQLQLNWTYSKNLHRSVTIRHLANQHLRALRDLIVHCQSIGSGTFTASDVPAARISERDLGTLMKRLAD